jgi:hypothetical protein
MTIEDFRFETSDIMELIPLEDATFPNSDGKTDWGDKEHSNYSLDDFAEDILPDFDITSMNIDEVNSALIERNLMPLDIDVYDGETGYAIRVDNEYFVVPGEKNGKIFFKSAQFHMRKPVLSLEEPEIPTDFWTGEDLVKIIFQVEPRVNIAAAVYLAKQLWKECREGADPQTVAETTVRKGWFNDFLPKESMGNLTHIARKFSDGKPEYRVYDFVKHRFEYTMATIRYVDSKWRIYDEESGQYFAGCPMGLKAEYEDKDVCATAIGQCLLYCKNCPKK